MSKIKVFLDLSNYNQKRHYEIMIPGAKSIFLYFGKHVSYKMSDSELCLLDRIIDSGNYSKLKGNTHKEKMQYLKDIPFDLTLSELNTLLKLGEIFNKFAH